MKKIIKSSLFIGFASLSAVAFTSCKKDKIENASELAGQASETGNGINAKALACDIPLFASKSVSVTNTVTTGFSGIATASSCPNNTISWKVNSDCGTPYVYPSNNMPYSSNTMTHVLYKKIATFNGNLGNNVFIGSINRYQIVPTQALLGSQFFYQSSSTSTNFVIANNSVLNNSTDYILVLHKRLSAYGVYIPNGAKPYPDYMYAPAINPTKALLYSGSATLPAISPYNPYFMSPGLPPYGLPNAFDPWFFKTGTVGACSDVPPVD